MKDMLGGSYWQAVRGTWLAEWSMNCVMAGMVPVMVMPALTRRADDHGDARSGW